MPGRKPARLVNYKLTMSPGELKKIGEGGVGLGGWGGQLGGSGWGGQVGGLIGGGFRVDVNAMLGVGGDVGYGGCEPRIEGIVQCTKRYCTILRKLK